MTSTEEPWTSWLCDLEAEDYSFISQSDGNLAPHNNEALENCNNNNSNSKRSFSADSSISNNNSSGDDNSSSLSAERAAKTPRTSTSNSTPSSYILSFNSPNPAPRGGEGSRVVNHERSSPARGSPENQKEPRRSNNHHKTASALRSPQHAHDHIIAERLRREKISQQFIALSALIPGLKKMDKATVLGDAIKYVKQLQEKVKVLEEQDRKKNVESVVYVEKSLHCAEEDVSDTNSSNSGHGNSYEISKMNRSLPEVEARVSEKNVLIRIHCEKQKGVFMYILKEIEKLHLSVINSSALLFGTSIIDITITAEMGDEFSLGVKELARKVRGGLLQCN